MRISDWSSDVCSSDLMPASRHGKAIMARDCCPIRETRKHQPGVIVIGAELPPIQARVGVEYAQAAHQQYGHADEVRPMPEARGQAVRSEEPTSELQSLMRISYAVLCMQKKIQ